MAEKRSKSDNSGLEPNCTVVQNLTESSAEEQKKAYQTLQGVALHANKVAPQESEFPRDNPWIDYNVMHMLHPEAVLIAQTDAKSTDPQKKAEGDATLAKHEQNLEALASFLKDLNWNS